MEICQETQDRIFELMEVSESAEVEQELAPLRTHLSGCPICQAELEIMHEAVELTRRALAVLPTVAEYDLLDARHAADQEQLLRALGIR